MNSQGSFRLYPLLFCVFGIIFAGIFQNCFNSTSFALWGVVLFTGISFLLPRYWWLSFTIITFFFSSYLLSKSSKNHPNWHELEGYHNEIVEVKGVVSEISYLDLGFFAKENFYYRFDIISKDPNFLEGKNLRVYINDEKVLSILPGDELTIVGRFQVPKPLTVPGNFSTRDYFSKENIWGKISCNGSDSIHIIGGGLNLERFLYQLRKRIYLQFQKSFSDSAAAFLSSVVLGYKKDLQTSTLEEFREWGISHIFAISGLHLGLIAGWAWVMSGLLFISLRKRSVFVLLSALVCCLLSGAAVPAIRAFVMISFLLLGNCFYRKTNTWNNLSLAFIVLFLWDTQVIFHAGFQMSFMAVASILLGYFLLPKEAQSVDSLLEKKGFLLVIGSYSKKLFFYSLLISIATAGVCLYHFHQFSWGGFFLNVIIIPFFTVVLILAFVGAFFSFILPRFFLFPFELIFLFFIGIPQKLKGITSFVLVPSHHYLWPLIFYASCMVICFVVPKRKLAYLTLILLGYIVLLKIILVRHEDRISVLDVGKANAVVLQTAGGKSFLFDCGSSSGYDYISSFLRAQGVDGIHFVSISHDHADHFNCFFSVLDRMGVEEVVVNPTQFPPSALGRQIIPLAKQEGLVVKPANRGDILFKNSSLTIKVMHPLVSEKMGSKNEESVVLLVQLAWCEILIPGDIQKEGVQQLLAQEELGHKKKKRVLLLPHHGRNIDYLEDLISFFQPDILMCSGDAISDDVIEVLQKVKLPFYFTAERGSIELSSKGLRCYYGEVWQPLQVFGEVHDGNLNNTDNKAYNAP